MGQERLVSNTVKMRICMCVCVCVCPHPSILGDSPSDQGETCASLCSVRRGLHFAADIFRPSKPNGVAQEGENTGHFSFSLFFDAPPPPAVLASIFYREGFNRPFARRQQSRRMSNIVNSRSFSAFDRFRPPATNVRNPLFFEPVTWLLEGCVDTT